MTLPVQTIATRSRIGFFHQRAVGFTGLGFHTGPPLSPSLPGPTPLLYAVMLSVYLTLLSAASACSVEAGGMVSHLPSAKGCLLPRLHNGHQEHVTNQHHNKVLFVLLLMCMVELLCLLSFLASLWTLAHYSCQATATLCLPNVGLSLSFFRCSFIRPSRLGSLTPGPVS